MEYIRLSKAGRVCFRACSAALVFVFAWSSLSTLVLAQAAAPEAYDIINRVNAYRAELGLPPFTINARLMDTSANQIDYLTSTGLYTHSGWNGSRPQDRAIAAGYNGRVSEVFVAGSSMSPGAGLEWWKNSPIHHRIITSNRYVQAGASYGYAFKQHWFVMVVGIPSGAPLPTARPVSQPAAKQAADSSISDSELFTIPTPELEVDFSPPPIIVTPIPLNTPEADGSISHVLAPGQALWTLSAYYDVEIDVLLAINNLDEDDLVMPGDRVRIRLADDEPMPTPPPTPTPIAFHVIQSGESLWTIAGQHGITFNEILKLNALTQGTIIRPGDELRVSLRPGESYPPTATPIPTATPVPVYRVRSGQFLSQIAALHGLPLEQLLEWNDLSKDSLIFPGDKLLVVEPTETAEPQTLVDSQRVTRTPRPTKTPSPTATALKIEQATRTRRPTATPKATELAVLRNVDGVDMNEGGKSVESIPKITEQSINMANTANSTPLSAMATSITIGLMMFGAAYRFISDWS